MAVANSNLRETLQINNMILGAQIFQSFRDGNFVAQTQPRDVAEYHGRIHPCTGNREWSEPRCPEQEIFQGI